MARAARCPLECRRVAKKSYPKSLDLWSYAIARGSPGSPASCGSLRFPCDSRGLIALYTLIFLETGLE